MKRKTQHQIIMAGFAIGLDCFYDKSLDEIVYDNAGVFDFFNPRKRSKDAFRLMAELGLAGATDDSSDGKNSASVSIFNAVLSDTYYVEDIDLYAPKTVSKEKLLRKAITIMAAKIGEKMKADKEGKS